MDINAEECIGREICPDYGNVGAISIEDGVAFIDQDVCVRVKAPTRG